jgi:hypothetical protein
MDKPADYVGERDRLREPNTAGAWNVVNGWIPDQCVGVDVGGAPADRW